MEQTEDQELQPRSAAQLFKRMKQKVLFAARMIKAANKRKKARIKGSLNDIDNSELFLREKILDFFKRKRIDTEVNLLTKEQVINLGVNFGVYISQFQASEALFSAYHRFDAHRENFKRIESPRKSLTKVPSKGAFNSRNTSLPPITAKREESRSAERKSSVEQFDLQELVSWFHRNIKLLRPIEGAKKEINPILGIPGLKRSKLPEINEYQGRTFQTLGRRGGGSIGSHNKLVQYRTASVGRMREQEILDTEQSYQLQSNISITLDKIQRNPVAKQDLPLQLKEIRQRLKNMDAVKGHSGQSLAVRRLKEKKEMREQHEDEMLSYIIKNEPDARQATNLHRLLSKKWVERKNGFKILSPLSDTQMLRVNTILDERFKR